MCVKFILKHANFIRNNNYNSRRLQNNIKLRNNLLYGFISDTVNRSMFEIILHVSFILCVDIYPLYTTCIWHVCL